MNGTPLHHNILIVMHDSYADNNVISIQREGNCSFRAVSYCIQNTEDRHYEMRLNTVNKIMHGSNYKERFHRGSIND